MVLTSPYAQKRSTCPLVLKTNVTLPPLLRLIFLYYVLGNHWLDSFAGFFMQKMSLMVQYGGKNYANKNIILCSFKSSGTIQKKEGGPDSCFG